MKYQYILWDFDGTLVDTSQGIYEALEYSLTQMGIELPPKEMLTQFIGPPLGYSFQTFLGMTQEQSDRAVKIFRGYYKETAVYHSVVYDGLIRVIEQLREKGAKIGVATLKPQPMAELLLRYFEMDHLIDFCCGSQGDDSAVADKTQLVHDVLAGLGCTDYAQAVLIGDTEYDAFGAKKAGIDFIAAAYGFGLDSSRQEELQWVCYANNASEIETFLLEQ